MRVRRSRSRGRRNGVSSRRRTRMKLSRGRSSR